MFIRSPRLSGLFPSALVAASLLACESPSGSDGGAADAALDAATADAGSDAALVLAMDPTHFEATGAMLEARLSHIAVATPAGVIMVGGVSSAFTGVLGIERYDETEGVFELLAQLSQGRENHTATLLRTGEILIVGGGGTNDVGAPSGRDVLGTCLLLNPATGVLRDAAPMHLARSAHAATLLEDGRVLVTGGAVAPSSANPTFGQATADAEIYDPATDSWTDAGTMPVARWLHTAHRTADGRVIVVGGSDEAEAELPDVVAYRGGAFEPASTLATARVFHAAEIDGEGTLWVVAGKLSNRAFLADSERLAAGASAFGPGPLLPQSRTAPTLTRLPSGHLLLTGGLHGSLAGFMTLSDAYVLNGDLVTPIDAMSAARSLHSATALADGSILICGGLAGSALASCERAVP